MGKELIQARDLALVKLLIFAAAALFALVLTIWLFVTRKKREYGILRALGMSRGEAMGRLFIPLLILGAVSTVLGTLAAFLFAGEAAASALLLCLGSLGFLVLIQRRSIWVLVQEGRK